MSVCVCVCVRVCMCVCVCVCVCYYIVIISISRDYNTVIVSLMTIQVVTRHSLRFEPEHLQ